MSKTALFLFLLGPLLIAQHRTPIFPPAPPPRNDITIENRVPIPMRDGVILYADIYRPSGDEAHPVLVSRTPYSVERAPSAYAAAVFFARRGYAYVFQDVRGRHESEGVWDPARYEFKDGYDTVEWAGSQPWSNGKVGMQGGSYLGSDQWQAAKLQPPQTTPPPIRCWLGVLPLENPIASVRSRSKRDLAGGRGNRRGRFGGGGSYKTRVRCVYVKNPVSIGHRDVSAAVR